MNLLGSILIILISLPCLASAEEAAVKAAVEAGMKQSGMDVKLEEYLRKKVPEFVVVFFQKIGPISDIAANQKVTLEWKF